jgi:Tfp pilus assembly PilM family ATPase
MMITLSSPGPIGRLLRRGSSRTAIGIDAGSRSFKAIQLQRMRGGKARVVAAAVRSRNLETPVSNNASAANASANAAPASPAVTSSDAIELANALGASGFSGNRLVLSAPADAVLISQLELPPKTSQAPHDQLARMEVARNFRCTPDSFEMAWWEMPAGMRGGRGTEAMSASLPHAKADALLDAFENPGLEVDAIETQQSAILRACKSVLLDRGVTAILDLGWGPATLTFSLQEKLTFSRRIPEGALGALHSSLCKTLAIEADVADYLLTEIGVNNDVIPARDEADRVEMPEEGLRLVTTFTDTLVKELSLSFSYATHQYPEHAVGKLLLVGGGAAMAGLAHRLSGALGVDVVPIAPADIAICDPSLLGLCSSPGMTLALGLAMRELES